MAVIDPTAPKVLKVDRPRELDRAEDGRTAVARHFEDGSSRTTIYDQHGGAKIITRRRNPSSGAEETRTENPDGTTVIESNRPDGSSTLVEISATGQRETTEQGKDASGNATTKTTFPDGSVQQEVTVKTADGSKLTRTNRDGSQTTIETKQTQQGNGDTLTSTFTSDGTGKILTSQTTLTRQDGSVETTTLVDGNPTVIQTQTTLSDGAVRVRTHDIQKNTIETTLTREYAKDGAKVKEVLGENDLRISTTRPDGSTSDVTKFDDGTQQSTDFTIRPDGTKVFTQTNRDKTSETTEHLPAKTSEPARTVTTASDGTRTEQVLDDERMTTTVRHPDGTQTVTRRDMDGVGSTAEIDATGRTTSVTTHDGEPLEAFGDLGPAPAPAPTPGPAPGPDPDPAPGPQPEVQRETTLEEPVGDIAGRGVALEPEVAARLQAEQAAAGVEAERPIAAAADIDPVTGEVVPVVGAPGPAPGVQIDQPVAAAVAAPDATAREAMPAVDTQPAVEAVAAADPVAEVMATDVTQAEDAVGVAEPEPVPEPEPEPEGDVTAEF